MPQAEGAQGQILLAEETTYNQDPSPLDAVVLPFARETLGMRRNRIERETITKNRNKRMPKRGKQDVTGDITVELNNHAHAYLLKHLLGSVATAGSSAPYTHTFKVGPLPVGLVIEKGFTDIGEYFKYNGCKVARAAFDFRDEGIIAPVFTLQGSGKETVSGTPMDADPVELADEVFDGFEASIEEGGAEIATVTEVNFEVNNDLDPGGYTVGSQGIRHKLSAGFCVVTGNLTAMFDSVALYNKAVNHTESSLKITLTRDTDNSIEFLIPELVFDPEAPVIEGPRGVLVRLPFMAYYDDSGEQTSIQVTVKNDMATIG